MSEPPEDIKQAGAIDETEEVPCLDTAMCSCSSSFDTSEGAFPDGYCVWKYDLGGLQLISCHCRPGYVCKTPMTRPPAGYPGQRFRWRCVDPACPDGDGSSSS